MTTEQVFDYTGCHKRAPALRKQPGARTDLSRRPIMSKRIRSLRPGERVPDSDPRRYLSADGYWRLRWRIGKEQYVEAYEHRVFDGRVTTAPHVHHRNHIKTDNRPENLLQTTPAEHLAHHRSVDRAKVVRLYLEGLSTPEIGSLLGINPATAYRILVAEGIKTRDVTEAGRLQRADVDPEVVRRLHEAGVRVRRIAKVLGVSATPVQRIVEELGLPPHRDGRPTNAELAAARAAIESVA